MIRSWSARLTALVTANCVAAFAVAVITWAGYLVMAFIEPGDGGLSSAIGFAVVLGPLVALYSVAFSFPVFSVGLIVIGIPTWWALHRKQPRGRGPFIVVGAIESAIIGAIVFRLFAPGSEVLAPLLAIPGGLAGWAIRTFGYTPIKPPPARPS